jgi:hypothetical protein
MPNARRPQEFDLHVHFTGLCLFVEHRNDRKVTVVMPDARMPTNGKTPHHDDGYEATPHVGYIAYDLANVQTTGTSGIVASPPHLPPENEVVRQLNHVDVDIGSGLDGFIDRTYLQLPRVNDFANLMALHQDVLKPDPRQRVLARVVLNGGNFLPAVKTARWRFKGDLNSDGAEKVFELSGDSHWRAEHIQGSGITLRITPVVAGGTTTEIPLVAMNTGGPRPTITLKFANLCATNNLEWTRFHPSTMMLAAGKEDDDFKWLYKLLEPSNGSGYPAVPLPHPIPVDGRSELQDCFGARIALAN